MPLNAAAIKRRERESAGQQDTNGKTNVNAQQSKQKAIKSMPKGSRKHTHTHLKRCHTKCLNRAA